MDFNTLLEQYFSKVQDMATTQRTLAALLDSGRPQAELVVDMGKIYKHANLNPRDALEAGQGNNAIGYYLLLQEYQQALTLFQLLHSKGKSRRKQLHLLIRYLAHRGDWDEACNLYLGFVMSFDKENRVVNGDVDIFYGCSSTLYKDVLQLFLGKSVFCNIDVPTVIADSLPLKKLHFTETQQDLMLCAMQKLFANRRREFMELLKDETFYDYIIDGANVLFYGAKSAVHAYQNIVNVIKMIPRDKKILLVLHQDHFKLDPGWPRHRCIEIKKTLNVIRDRCSILQTAPKINDDYYSLLCATIRPGSLLVTNDKFRDHIFAQETEQAAELLSIWRLESVVEYDMDRLYYPNPYSNRVQRDGNKYYIPHATANAWCVVET